MRWREEKKTPERPVPPGTWLVRDNGVLRAISPTAPKQFLLQRRFDAEPRVVVASTVSRVRRGTVVRVTGVAGEQLDLMPERDPRLGLEDLGTVLPGRGGFGGSGSYWLGELPDIVWLVGLLLLPIAVVVVAVVVPSRYWGAVRRAGELKRALQSGPAG